MRDGEITRVLTDHGDYHADTVILAAGMWSRELGAKLGLNVPACAVEHQYIVTEPLPEPDLVKALPHPARPGAARLLQTRCGRAACCGWLRG